MPVTPLAPELLERQGREGLGDVIEPFALSLVGLALLAFQPLAASIDPLLLATLTVAALLVARLSVSLPALKLPTNLLPLILIPTWELGGAWVAGFVGLLASLMAAPLGGRSRLPWTWQPASSLTGAGLGALLALACSAFIAPGMLADIARAVSFALGLWAAQCAVEWFSPRRRPAQRSWPVGLLTNLVLAPPGAFLAQIGSSGDRVLFVVSLGVALGVVILIRASTNSETRSVELEARAVSSANAVGQLELIVDQAPEAIVGLDGDGNVRWLNRTAVDWLGDRAEQAVGQTASEALRVRSANGALLDHAGILARAREARRPMHGEGWLEGEPGAPERVLASYSAAGERSDGDFGLMLLRDANVVPETLREQEDLAVHLSHELRAPLTTILGYAQLMANPRTAAITADSQTEFAKRISESGDYMLRLINNLLDLGRLARKDGVDMPKGRIDVRAVTEQVVEAHRPESEAKGQQLSFSGPPEPVQLFSSDLALREILTNLLSNAVKYTPSEGHVRIELVAEPNFVTLYVVDDGIGLLPEEINRLFTKFFRSQRPEARLIKGTGLGLALTKELVEHLGGTIQVQSAVNEGSTFSVQLPR